MTCWVIIPAKATAEAKGRLADVLDADARARLARAMLGRAVGAVQTLLIACPTNRAVPPIPSLRHPELVSGSIVPLRSGTGVENAAVRPDPLAQELRNPEEWILKRVQDDGEKGVEYLQLALVGTSRLGQSDTIELLHEPEGGLNAAVSSARETVAARGANRIVTLAGDLPQVTSYDVKALAELPPGVIGIAPDRHGTGTNALSLPLPEALGFTYSYGPGSCAKHKAEAARLGLSMREIITPGLARDIDEPADLTDAQALLAAHEG